MPRVEAIESDFEQPDILLAYANRELTIFGITGTLKDLADMCPVDLNDPRITQEAKNEFAIKALNESGQTIEPEHEELFTKVIEKNSLERKFIVDPVIKNPSVKKDEPSPVNKFYQSRETKQLSIAPKTLTNSIPNKADLSASVRVQSPNYAQEDLAAVVPKTIHNRDIVQVIQKLTQADLDKQSENKEIADLGNKPSTLDQEVSRMSTLTEYLTTITQTEYLDIVDLAIDPLSIGGNDPDIEINSIISNANSENQIIFADSPLIYQQQYPTEPISEAVVSEEQLQDVEISWQTELSKEAEEQYLDFTVALQNLVELMLDHPVLIEDKTATAQLYNSENQETILPDLVIVLAERLSKKEINDREVVTPILKNIISQLNNIQLLKAQEIQSEIVLEVEAKLKELVFVLFESLGIDCNEQQVEQFIRLMLSSKFQPPQTVSDQEKIDLEKIGTHEVKLRLGIAKLSSSLIGAEDRLLQALGMLALFWVQGTGTSLL